jgi:hypothetical protein
MCSSRLGCLSNLDPFSSSRPTWTFLPILAQRPVCEPAAQIERDDFEEEISFNNEEGLIVVEREDPPSSLPPPSLSDINFGKKCQRTPLHGLGK